ncbi:MAG: hypothetical protein IJK92_00625 [Bacteroidales bacterium]|nr:hypothetical protein [Bacteroidales bacterium]
MCGSASMNSIPLPSHTRPTIFCGTTMLSMPTAAARVSATTTCTSACAAWARNSSESGAVARYAKHKRPTWPCATATHR